MLLWQVEKAGHCCDHQWPHTQHIQPHTSDSLLLLDQLLVFPIYTYIIISATNLGSPIECRNSAQPHLVAQSSSSSHHFLPWNIKKKKILSNFFLQQLPTFLSQDTYLSHSKPSMTDKHQKLNFSNLTWTHWTTTSDQLQQAQDSRL